MLCFKPIELSDRQIMKAFFDVWKFEGSELTFTNLYIWQPHHDIQYCVHDNVLYIKLFESGRLCFLPPIPGDADIDYQSALQHVENFMQKCGYKLEIRCANTKLKTQMEMCCKQNLHFKEDRANYDYIYLASDLIELAGNKYHGKRNHINKFLSEYRCEYHDYDDDFFDACMQVYDKWHEGKNVHPGEPHAVKTALREHKELGLKGCVLTIGGQAVAFSMGEQITGDMAVIHIEKAILPGAFSYINQQFAQHAWSGMKYINREEDMGIEGMRKAKMSYNPAYLIEKYTVAANGGCIGK